MFSFQRGETIPEREERILKLWKDKKIFEKSIEQRKGGPFFSFYDGPPFATGLPHYGHLLAGILKDVIPRYKTMCGYWVPRRFGWDCHGLPVENEIEKAQELSGAASIEAYGIAQFNEECRKIVLRYTSEWKKTVNRIGRWVDFSHTYRTMDISFMESVWWVFSQLYQKGLVYEGFKVMPCSTKLGTPLSNFEANLNYKEVDDPSLVVQFAVQNEPYTYFLAWTTTPWTLPSNLALMVHPDATYVKICKGGKNYILAEARAPLYFKEEGEVVERFSGRKLKNRRYTPLFPFFAQRADQAFRVVLEETVSMEDGTGIVHAAPGFGEVDFYACKREDIELVCPVDSNGYFTMEVPPYAGMLVKDADREIIRDLKRQGLIFAHSNVRHRYPFCWRSDTPLIYKAVRTWFVAVEKLKSRLVAVNEQINWIPEHIQHGRFGKWLENARDWAISRNRYWGTPIPIWRNARGDCIVISSIEELEKRTNTKITDLHRHYIDSLTFEENGERYERILEVFDCWFESGSMPYAQNHYPFENKEFTEEGFPADFIAEGLDQTRGWFYTLNVLSVALFDREAFKNVVVNGIILAEDGNKMSKRLRNYPDPEEVLSRFGADAVRLYMLQSPAVRADEMRFAERGVEQILRQVLLPLWNSFVFLSTYAKIYHWHPEEISAPEALIDRWLLSLSQKLVQDVTQGLDRYHLNQAVDPFLHFIDQLTNWYIRRCRGRFWSEGDTQDRKEAFGTLYTVLLTLVKVAAPLTPFVTEAIYQQLRTSSMPISVHLCDFPQVNRNLRNEALELEVETAQRVVSLGHALRKEHKLKVRQPLAAAHIITMSHELLHALKQQQELIADELNVKTITWYSDESQFVQWVVKPNFPVLGKKIGKAMPQAKEALAHLTSAQIHHLLQKQPLELVLGAETIVIAPEDVQLERHVKPGLIAGNAGELTVALDTALTEELLLEGLAREIINKINTMRRDQGLEVTDRIALVLQTTPRVKEAFQRHHAYICGEVLAVKADFHACEGALWDLNGEEAIIALSVQNALV